MTRLRGFGQLALEVCGWSLWTPLTNPAARSGEIEAQVFPSIAPDRPGRSLESQVKTSTHPPPSPPHSTLGSREGVWTPQRAAVDQNLATSSSMSLACPDIVVHGLSHGATSCGLCLSYFRTSCTNWVNWLNQEVQICLPRRSGRPGPYETALARLIASSQRHKKLNFFPSRSVIMQQATATD